MDTIIFIESDTRVSDLTINKGIEQCTEAKRKMRTKPGVKQNRGRKLNASWIA